jgi:hypothetical protein
MEKLSAKNKLKNEAKKILEEGAELYKKFTGNDKTMNFPIDYQIWYSKALKIIEIFAKDRYPEFRGYYEVDPKRKILDYGNYVIQDYLKNIVPSAYRNFDSNGCASRALLTQITILKSVIVRIDSIVNNIEETLLYEVQDSELNTAKILVKVSPRAGGAMAGVVMETYLQKVIKNNAVPFTKKNPVISEMNDVLKANEIIDLLAWKKIVMLAEIRNRCSHRKEEEPTREEVLELIDGINWVIKNVN